MSFEMVTFDATGFPTVEEPKPKNLWCCIDPCAFVCYAVQINAIPFDSKVRETLDNFGWLNEDGFPDYAKMMREFQRNV